MESIAVTFIDVTATPTGVVESNSRSRAVMELKIDEFTSSEPTNPSRKWPWSGATLTRFCDELTLRLPITACIPVLLTSALSRQTLAHSDCHTTNETY